MNNPYFPLLVIFVLAAVVVLALLLIASKVGPKSSNPAKAEPFESGNPPRGDARIRISVKFYLIAMLFLIFDLEVVFLYPWAIYLRQLGVFRLGTDGNFPRHSDDRLCLHVEKGRSGLGLMANGGNQLSTFSRSGETWFQGYRDFGAAGR